MGHSIQGFGKDRRDRGTGSESPFSALPQLRQQEADGSHPWPPAGQVRCPRDPR